MTSGWGDHPKLSSCAQGNPSMRRRCWKDTARTHRPCWIFAGGRSHKPRVIAWLTLPTGLGAHFRGCSWARFILILSSSERDIGAGASVSRGLGGLDKGSPSKHVWTRLTAAFQHPGQRRAPSSVEPRFHPRSMKRALGLWQVKTKPVCLGQPLRPDLCFTDERESAFLDFLDPHLSL